MLDILDKVCLELLCLIIAVTRLGGEGGGGGGGGVGLDQKLDEGGGEGSTLYRTGDRVGYCGNDIIPLSEEFGWIMEL